MPPAGSHDGVLAGGAVAEGLPGEGEPARILLSGLSRLLPARQHSAPECSCTCPKLLLTLEQAPGERANSPSAAAGRPAMCRRTGVRGGKGEGADRWTTLEGASV